MQTVLQYVVTGTLFGGVLALLASGLSLIFGVMRLVNFAQGDFVMLGMYIVFTLYSLTSMNPILLAVGAMLAVGIAGYLLHYSLIGRVARRATPGVRHDAQLILTIGLSLVLQNLALMIYGSDPKSLMNPDRASSWEIAGVSVSLPRAEAFLVAGLFTAALFYFLHRTKQGLSMRAAADDPVAAEYVGVNVARAHRLAFALGTGAAAAGGGLLSTFYTVQPYVGWDFIVLMFVAVVLGGMGSVLGASVGGLIIGLVWSLSLLVLPLQLQYVGVFTVFLLILFVRPQGIFGMKERA